MKQILAFLGVMVISSLACAQLSNFTGVSGAVNLSATPYTEYKIPGEFPSGSTEGGHTWILNFQGAYGIPLSENWVIGLGASYATGKNKAFYESANGATGKVDIRDRYALYVEPGILLNDNMLLYGKVSVEKGTSVRSTGSSKSVSGSGYGAGFRHILGRNI